MGEEAILKSSAMGKKPQRRWGEQALVVTFQLTITKYVRSLRRGKQRELTENHIFQSTIFLQKYPLKVFLIFLQLETVA